MSRVIEKIVAVFALCVFLSMLVTHGSIDFTLWDKTTEATKNAVESEQGQELIQETKDTAWNVADTIISKLKSTSEQAKAKAKDKNPEAASLIEVQLKSVVDGDTIIVAQEGREDFKIRLIGIDTPESVHSDETKNNKYGDMASSYTKSLLSNISVVYIQYDTLVKDTYDRDLCYVWLKNDVDVSNTQDIANYMLNGILIRNGYAYNKDFAPNIKYSDVFLQLREDAQDTKAGLWQYKEFEELWNQ